MNPHSTQDEKQQKKKKLSTDRTSSPNQHEHQQQRTKISTFITNKNKAFQKKDENL